MLQVILMILNIDDMMNYLNKDIGGKYLTFWKRIWFLMRKICKYMAIFINILIFQLSHKALLLL